MVYVLLSGIDRALDSRRVCTCIGALVRIDCIVIIALIWAEGGCHDLREVVV